MKYLSSKKGFLGIDAVQSRTPQVIVVPFGLEKTVSYGSGTKNGPKEIIKASHQVELFDEELNKEPYKEIGIKTLKPFSIKSKINNALDQLSKINEDILSDGKFPLVFGGEQPFTIPWLNVDYCEANCSFVSGDVSFFTLSLAILLIFNKQTWNIFAYFAIILISLLRIMEGDHFLSDTIMSFIITYVVIRVLYDLFQLLPEDLNLKRKTKLKRT